MTTRNQLAAALADIATGYTAASQPILGRRIGILANRVQQRLRFGDPRLDAFTPHTDLVGYPWLPQSVHDYLADESTFLWSFDRWFTGLASAAANAEPPSRDELEQLAAEAARIEAAQ